MLRDNFSYIKIFNNFFKYFKKIIRYKCYVYFSNERFNEFLTKMFGLNIKKIKTINKFFKNDYCYFSRIITNNYFSRIITNYYNSDFISRNSKVMNVAFSKLKLMNFPY